MAESQVIAPQVSRWVDSYDRRLKDAMAASFPRVLSLYHDVLIEEAPARATRPGTHPHSRNETWKLYRFLMDGRHRAYLTNTRTSRKGDVEVSGYVDMGYTKAGPRKAKGFLSRGIGDSYSAWSWRKAQPKIRAFWPDALLKEIARG